MFPDSLLHQPVFFPYLFPKNKQTSYCSDWNSLPPVCSASKRVHNMSPAFWSGKMQRHEKIDALKPVASRPFSSFRSFPKPLQDFTSTGSPPITVLEETVLVKPKATQVPIAAKWTSDKNDCNHRRWLRFHVWGNEGRYRAGQLLRPSNNMPHGQEAYRPSLVIWWLQLEEIRAKEGESERVPTELLQVHASKLPCEEEGGDDNRRPGCWNRVQRRAQPPQASSSQDAIVVHKHRGGCDLRRAWYWRCDAGVETKSWEHSTKLLILMMTDAVSGGSCVPSLGWIWKQEWARWL